MEGNARIPPAINELFVKTASQVCDRARMDYDEWLVNSQELAFHLQQRWRDGIEQGLNSEQAKNHAFKLFGDPHLVAKSLRKPWLTRLLCYKRFQPERFGFFILAFFFYTWHVIIDMHWKSLVRSNIETPFQILLPFNLDFVENGLGTMFVGFAAAGCVVLADWQPRFKKHWLNQICLSRHLLFLFTGYALFSLIVRFPFLAIKTLPEMLQIFPSYNKVIIPYAVIHCIVILVCWFGAFTLLREIWGKSARNIRMNMTLAGMLLGLLSTFGLPLPNKMDATEPPLPNLNSTINFYSVTDTKIGSEVRPYLLRQKWFQTWKPEAVEQIQDERKVTQIFNARTASYNYVYFYENGAWKFHDIQLKNINGVNLEMDLSMVIRDPRAAQGILLLRNGQLAGAQRKFVDSLFH